MPIKFFLVLGIKITSSETCFCHILSYIYDISPTQLGPTGQQNVIRQQRLFEERVSN